MADTRVPRSPGAAPVSDAPPERPEAGGTTNPLLEMQAITKDFPSGRVLHGVDLVLEAGTVHALVGENGAGKSTLMKILAGVYPDYGGTVRLAGEPVQMSSPRVGLDHGVAVIYQENSLVPDLTVAQNIALGREEARLGRLHHAATIKRSGEEADSLGIELPLDRRVGELDVGEQQMTEIVKAVARRARVLVMDEPTARLSMTERQRLFDIVRRLATRGVGIVYISHFLEEVFAVCSHVTILRDGHRVDSQPLAKLSIRDLAQMMIGDKLDAIERDSERRQTEIGSTLSEQVALRLRDVEVVGKVAPVSLELARGEVIGFAGLQDSGRSDLARALIGSMAGTQGAIDTATFSGLPNDPLQAAKAGILLLPANRKTDGIISVRAVKDNVELSALRSRLSRRGLVRAGLAKRVVRELLDRFAVRPQNPDLVITALSGGNQQKVLFARAAAAEAQILILDQPTAGVDIGAKVELYEQIDLLTAEGVSVLLISDDLTELLRLSGRIVLMHKGIAGKPRPVTDFDRPTLLAAITGPDLAMAS